MMVSTLSKLESTRQKLTVWLSAPQVGKPVVDGVKGQLQSYLYPAECRERGLTYKATFQIKVNYRVGDGKIESEVRNFGKLPIMVNSLKCNLHGLSPKEMVARHEDAEEFGGYFISNGIERLIRLLIVPRRNCPIAIIRPSFQNRGPTFSEFGVQMRCVRPDQTSLTVTLHYCNDGEIYYRFSCRKNEYTVPVLLILRALQQTSDEEIFERLTMGDHQDSFLTDRIEMLLRSFRKYSLYKQEECLDFLGTKFADMLSAPADAGSFDIAREFIDRIVYVHLDSHKAKFDLMMSVVSNVVSICRNYMAWFLENAAKTILILCNSRKLYWEVIYI
jgi:DNA-directed RNA polymerase I subunit RPA2